MTTFKWYFKKMECFELENYQNVIKKIHWVLVGTREFEGTEYNALLEGVLEIENPSFDNFVEFEKITEEMAISWTESKLNLLEKKQIIDSKLDLKTNQNFKFLNPPFYLNRKNSIKRKCRCGNNRS